MALACGARCCSIRRKDTMSASALSLPMGKERHDATPVHQVPPLPYVELPMFFFRPVAGDGNPTLQGCNGRSHMLLLTISTKNKLLKLKNSSDMLEEARNSSSRVVSMVEAHFAEPQKLQESHSNQVAGVNKHADSAFQASYKDYVPTGETLVRSEPNVPSKGSIGIA